jgi:hypothetical protein
MKRTTLIANNAALTVLRGFAVQAQEKVSGKWNRPAAERVADLEAFDRAARRYAEMAHEVWMDSDEHSWEEQDATWACDEASKMTKDADEWLYDVRAELLAKGVA